MNNKTKTIIKVIVGLLLGGALLYLAFKDVDWDDFTRNLREVSIGFISLGILMMFLSHISRALRWKQLIEANNVEVRASSAFWAVLFGYTVNNAIPRGGEIARCTILKESDNVPVAVSMGTVVVERAIDMIIMAALFSGILLLESGTFVEKLTVNMQSAKYVPYILLSLLIAFALFAYLLTRFQHFFYRFKILKPVIKFLVSLVEAILSIRKVKNKFLFVIHTAVIWLLYILSNYFIVQAFPMLPDKSFYFAYLIFVMGAIGIVIPSPGGLGSYHSIVVYLFEILNYSKRLGQLFAFVAHSAIYVPTTIAGGIAYFVLIFNKENKKES